MEKQNNYYIYDMTLSHLDDVMEIEGLSFATPWSRESFIHELEQNQSAKYKVIIMNGKAVAYGGMWILFDEAHITNIAVHPEYRGVGLGDVLLKALMDCALENGGSSMTLEVRLGNKVAINLYKKYGFKEVAIRKGYYSDTGEDALIMWKYDL